MLPKGPKIPEGLTVFEMCLGLAASFVFLSASRAGRRPLPRNVVPVPGAAPRPRAAERRVFLSFWEVVEGSDPTMIEYAMKQLWLFAVYQGLFYLVRKGLRLNRATQSASWNVVMVLNVAQIGPM